MPREGGGVKHRVKVKDVKAVDLTTMSPKNGPGRPPNDPGKKMLSFSTAAALQTSMSRWLAGTNRTLTVPQPVPVTVPQPGQSCVASPPRIGEGVTCSLMKTVFSTPAIDPGHPPTPPRTMNDDKSEPRELSNPPDLAVEPPSNQDLTADPSSNAMTPKAVEKEEENDKWTCFRGGGEEGGGGGGVGGGEGHAAEAGHSAQAEDLTAVPVVGGGEGGGEEVLKEEG